MVAWLLDFIVVVWMCVPAERDIALVLEAVNLDVVLIAVDHAANGTAT